MASFLSCGSSRATGLHSSSKRSSDSAAKLFSPFTVAGRVRATQEHIPQRTAAVNTALPVLERLHVPEAQNSIVPAPTLGSARRIEEVGQRESDTQSTLLARPLTGLRGSQVEQEPPVPLFVSLCDEIVAACHRQPEVRASPSSCLFGPAAVVGLCVHA